MPDRSAMRSISRRTGVTTWPSSGSTARALNMCVAAVVAAPDTPGCTILAPAENPAMWWGTTAPVPMTRSVLEQPGVHVHRRAVGRGAQVAQRSHRVVVLGDLDPAEHLVAKLGANLVRRHRAVRTQGDHHLHAVVGQSAGAQLLQDRRYQQVSRRFAGDVVDQDERRAGVAGRRAQPRAVNRVRQRFADHALRIGRRRSRVRREDAGQHRVVVDLKAQLIRRRREW